MAHNLNKRKDGSYAFAAYGQVAWHGLGNYVTEAMTAEQAIQLGGLDFDVAKKKILTEDGTTITDNFANVRTDTGDVLGIVSKDYQIVQNREAFSFFDSIIEKGEAIFHTAGALGSGERIFVTAKLPEDILVNGEQVNSYLLISSGHDGKSSIQVGFTPIRVVCNNTLSAALPGLKNKVTVMHFKNAKKKLEMASKVMGMASQYTVGLQKIFNQMAETKITDPKLKEYVMKVMEPQKETIDAETLQKKYSTRFLNKVNGILQFAHEHPTQQSREAKGTVWGAYNAISGYYGYQKKYKTASDKMNDILFKDGEKRISRAFDLAKELVTV